MQTITTLAKKLFKPVAVLKYLFFPFMIAQSQSAIDVSKILKSETVIAQAETQAEIWVATNNGLFQISKANSKFVRLTTANSVLPSNHVTGLCVTTNENVYASTNNGIFHFDGTAYLTISIENANLPTNNFTSVTCDETDRIFLGTESNGVVMMKNFDTKNFNKNNSVLTTNTVNNLYRDENGVIISVLADGNFVAFGTNSMVLIPQVESTDVVAKK